MYVCMLFDVCMDVDMYVCKLTACLSDSLSVCVCLSACICMHACRSLFLFVVMFLCMYAGR